MKSFRQILVVFVIGMLFASTVTTFSQSSGINQKNASLSSFNFFGGKWIGELDGGFTEETWSDPLGDNLIGTFRFVKETKALFYEFMTIEQTASGPILSIKHFGTGLIGWEEKDKAIRFALTDLGSKMAVFSALEEDSKLIFRLNDPDSLTITLEKTKDGKVQSQPFEFKKKKNL